ncbi:NnrU family protein [Novosphingobium sp.]|uniref:NnrU family protein n=1 Tax=Novosphingobium sp. TaxID=1874826 RepID=UPI0025E17B8A|nr:NnrU family protein [Novosphingobium sp.]
MDPSLTRLIAASLTFVGTHFVLSHPLRGAVVKAAGAKGFMAIYSLVALGSFAWMVLAFRAADSGMPAWNGQADAAWILATLIMIPASILLVGSFMGNPALPAPGAADLARQGPHGVFHITRHPMMWSFTLWSAAHLLVSPTPRVIVLTLAIAVLALVGAHLQDRKKEVLMGADWQAWEAKTSYWPRPAGALKAGWTPRLGGLALWLVATWAHIWTIGIPAGIWRWIG